MKHKSRPVSILCISICAWCGVLIEQLYADAVTVNPPCRLQQKIDKFTGMGVYAGKKYNKGDIIEEGFMVLVKHEKLKTSSVLNTYSFSHTGDQNAVLFGHGMVYNHDTNSSAHVVLSILERDSLLSDFKVIANRGIDEGEQLTIFYGDTWFRDRRLIQKNNDENSAQIVRGCPSDMTVQTSDGRVVAARFIRSGETVEVSRALIFSAWHGQATKLQSYAWFAPVPSKGVGMMLVLGNGALYRSVNSTEYDQQSYCANNGDNYPNLKYQWYNMENADMKVTCSNTMLVEFVATRDIYPSQELVIPMEIDSTDGRKMVVDTMLPGGCIDHISIALQHYLSSKLDPVV